MRKLRQAGVGSQVHYIPVYRLPYYAGRDAVGRAAFPAAERYYEACLSIPMHPGLSDDDVDYVVGCIKDVVGAR